MTLEDPRRGRSADQVSARLAADRWRAARYRCPCGYAVEDMEEFGRHLEAADRAVPEHFEVLDGWTLEQVRHWQAAVTSSSG